MIPAVLASIMVNLPAGRIYWLCDLPGRKENTIIVYRSRGFSFAAWRKRNMEKRILIAALALALAETKEIEN